MTLPYYPRYTKNFLDATSGWPLELKGAYSILLDLIYYHGDKLPDDARFIAGNLGCSVRKWNQIRTYLIARGKVILRLSEDNLEIISNKRAEKEAIKLRKYEDKQRENGAKAHENKDLTDATATPTDDPTGPAKPNPPQDNARETKEIRKKEEEGAREISGLKEEPPDPFLIRVIEAVGLAGRDLPRFWIGQPATDHVRAWITAHGLTEDEVVVEVAKSRTKNADPPDGPKALDRWMAQAGAAKQSAGTIKATKATDTPAKAPVSPEDRLQFFARWVKDTSQFMAPSTISNTLRDDLLISKMVTTEDLRARGIR